MFIGHRYIELFPVQYDEMAAIVGLPPQPNYSMVLFALMKKHTLSPFFRIMGILAHTAREEEATVAMGDMAVISFCKIKLFFLFLFFFWFD